METSREDPALLAAGYIFSLSSFGWISNCVLTIVRANSVMCCVWVSVSRLVFCYRSNLSKPDSWPCSESNGCVCCAQVQSTHKPISDLMRLDQRSLNWGLVGREGAYCLKCFAIYLKINTRKLHTIVRRGKWTLPFWPKLFCGLCDTPLNINAVNLEVSFGQRLSCTLWPAACAVQPLTGKTKTSDRTWRRASFGKSSVTGY